MVPGLAIPVDETIDVHVRKLAIGVLDTHIELEKVESELNVQIAEL